MDINSLLSPQETPNAIPTPPTKAPAKRSRKTRNAKAVNQPPVASAPTSTYKASVPAQRPAPTPLPSKPTSAGGVSVASTSSFDGARPYRQPSTAGMDTLADLASMQHHQQTARAKAGGLRSAEIYDSPKTTTTSLPNLHNMTRSEATSRLRAGSFDVTMSDSPQLTPPPRTYSSKALSETEIQAITEAGNHLLKNPFAYDVHVELINLLHKGLLNHIRLQSSSKTSGDPRSYELLQDLQTARDDMSSRFAVGENVWADWIQDQILLAVTFEDKIAIRELCDRAVSEEPTSSKIWLIYGQWMLSESDRHGARDEGTNSARNAQPGQLAPDEERAMAAEFFGWQQVLSIWRRGAQETMWRINDSQQLWDPYANLLIRDMGSSPQPEAISSMQHLFMNRLQTPHATWDQTSQKLSTFISTHYDNAQWESTMVIANRLGGEAKQKYDMRDFKEISLLRAHQRGDQEAEVQAFNEYINYELGLSRKKNAYSFELVNALYQRATLGFPSNTELWESYAIFLYEELAQQSAPGLSIRGFLEKATRHCPWSGTLWAQYIIAAEIEKLAFPEIGDIKHRATSSGILDVGDMDEVLKITTAWCGYLRRRAFAPDSTDEDMDVAEVGIRSAIEDLETIGLKKYGKGYQGDPDYRLEKIYIKYLSQARNWTAARDTYKRLIPRKGHDYDFWLRYYVWEMITWSKLTYTDSNSETAPPVRPTEATKVLQQAMRRTDLNWPEKILQTYLVHCEDHEDAEQLQSATVEFWKQTNALKKKREREAYEHSQYQQQLTQHSQPSQEQPALNNGDDKDHLGKRKREEVDESSSKKTRPEAISSTEPHVQEQTLPAPSLVKRDRENATVIVRNLPIKISEVKVRQYFRDCGTINSLKISSEEDGQSTCALIEFETKEDVLTAQTKDGKMLEGKAMEVQVGSGSTLYVCNFPPTADEAWIRDKFHEFGEIVDIRFPSLKYNTHRRFAYVQFKWPSQAHAAIKLDGEKTGENLELVAKISDPAHKQQRHGALYEGREVFVSNLPWTATWKDLKQLFSEYGSVESARVPQKINGGSKGIGFVVFRHQEDAKKALALHMTNWKGRTLNVAESTNDPAKKQASIAASQSQRATESPAPSANGDANSRASSARPDKDKKMEIQSRTFALMNVPDTVNEARIRALTEPYGDLAKVLLRPDHQGAIIEYKDQASVGKAYLALEGHEIAPGRPLSVGTVNEMKQLRDEKRSDKVVVGQKKTATALPTPILVRRPGVGASRRGGRGGLGAKRGVSVDSYGGKSTGAEQQHEDKEEQRANEADDGRLKTNADFKEMMMGK